MTTTEILTGVKNWVSSKLSLKQDVINDLADIRSGSQAGSTAVQPSDLSSYFNNASYDTNTHRINFYHGQNIVAYVDASPFIVDGMVNDVRIENGYLVIDFNTDSGKQDISIPLTDIFNPNNYYTKGETDLKFTKKQSEIDDLYARIGYYVCSTEGNVAAKTIVANDYTLGNGGSIKVKMTNANTADNATLNINSTGAKALYYAGERASANNSWEAGETVEVYYDGTSYYANNVTGGSGSGDGAFDVSVKYPTSGVDGGNTYTLDGALAVLNANLSANKKKGGMSIKFIQSSDNKYLQARLMADEFTTDTTQWAIADEGVYIENPEFIYVKTDKDGKILWAIKKDGGIYYGAGCPQQIKDYIEERISSLPLDEYEDIVAFLSDYLGSDTTLKVMIDEINAQIEDKLDAEGLDPEALGTLQAIENPEYFQVTTDSEDKILEGIKTDGTKVIELPLETQGVRQETIDNPEFIQVTTDKEGKVIEGIKKDGKKFIADLEGLNKIADDISEKILNDIKDDLGEKALSLDAVDFIDEPVTILSTEDQDVTLYDNVYMGFSSVMKISDSMYYMYYAAYGTASEHNPDDTPMEVGINILFAHSTDGLTWHRGFPQGIDAPNPGTNIIGIKDGNDNNLVNRVTEFHIFKVNDGEYPYRMLANHTYSNTAYACMWKSTDGINFTHYKRIIKATDTQLCGIPRGQIIKVYCRDYDKNPDGSRKFYPNGRRIGVFFIDYEGNLVSPRRVLFGKALYQSSAGILDEHSELLFPTSYGIYPDDVQRLKCFVVYGRWIVDIQIDDAILMDNYTMTSIYPSNGLVNINGSFYMFYMTSARKHNQTWTSNEKMEYRRIKVILTFN